MIYEFQYNCKAISKDNEKIRNRYGRVFLSKRFKQFEDTIRIMTRMQLKKDYPDFKIFDCDVMVHLAFSFKDKRHSDTFNLPKSICDALKGILYLDDKQIKTGIAERIYDNKEGIWLKITEAHNGNILLQSIS